jgi:hypothetical protein
MGTTSFYSAPQIVHVSEKSNAKFNLLRLYLGKTVTVALATGYVFGKQNTLPNNKMADRKLNILFYRN